MYLINVKCLLQKLINAHTFVKNGDFTGLISSILIKIAIILYLKLKMTKIQNNISVKFTQILLLNLLLDSFAKSGNFSFTTIKRLCAVTQPF